MNYREVGVIAQAIKASIRDGASWEELGGLAKESLDQIATAMARMVAGDGEHWDAISAYAHVAKPGTGGELTAVSELERSIRHEVITKLRGEPQSEGR